MGEVMIWNLGKTASVKASKIRSFSINTVEVYHEGKYHEKFELTGWFNSSECFFIGQFAFESDAVDWLENIHRWIEG